MKVDRGEKWKSIWDKKGRQADAPLHHIDGFDLLDDGQWEYMVSQVARPIGFKSGDAVLECGCGAGAFLSALLKQYPDLKVSGVDYSRPLLETAKKNIKGNFYCADMSDLGFIKDGQYDHVVAFSTFHYLSSEATARKVVREMVRVVRVGGVVFIGEVSNLEKREEALAIRKVTHKNHKRVSAANPDHLFLSKDFFRELAGDMRLGLKIMDQESFDLPFYETAKYRYSVYLTKESGT